MIHYNFDAETRLYIGSAPSDLDPLESAQQGEPVYATPGYATRIAPPSLSEGEIALFDEEAGWSVILDVRGAWYGADHAIVQIDNLDADVSALTRLEPTSADHELVDGQWVLSEARIALLLDLAKQGAQASIDAYYETLYRSSVVNSAVGAEYDAAYMVAKRWLDNQAEPAPERVKALAESYGVGNLQAAMVVVTKWTEAQAVAFDFRGAARLRAKTAIRAAVNKAGVDAALAAGKVAMESVGFTV